ncbi:MAG: glycerate kinase [Gemmataceae bacterium]
MVAFVAAAAIGDGRKWDFPGGHADSLCALAIGEGMDALEQEMRRHARAIWDAAVAAADPQALVRAAVTGALREELVAAPRIIVVGGGKAGAAMAAGLEETLADRIDRIEGIVNIPEGSELPLRKIVAHPARPAGKNFPTPEGVAGTERMLELLAGAGPDDVAVCLLSGGGSALLPAPAEGITLDDKLAVTKLLHSSGATIQEMNAVRKHLSRSKGGGFARAFRGKKLVSLIISDVVGDPLDVIASGPTAADPTYFRHARLPLMRYDLLEKIPGNVLDRIYRGGSSEIEETLKELPPNVQNRIIGNNAISLRAAQAAAERLGYSVLNLGAYVEGETREVANTVVGIVRSIRSDGVPLVPPACLLIGGETTVTLGPNPGKGGRNQEFALAFMYQLGSRPAISRVVALSGGTDGEDGPTDSAGAVVSSSSWLAQDECGVSTRDCLLTHNAYEYFEKSGDLLKTGLTGTNVMDVRVILVR